ncbi:MAG: hypothetical protein IT516_11130 [Burkholderiales bacterium]|nr:hypothetical protein [Burkholderiales bacterium]
MLLRTSLIVAVAILGASGCATQDPKPFANAVECFYPACSIDVTVVDDGRGGKKLALTDDGNVQMGTRHKVVAIVWNMRTPGYEFRADSIEPHTRRAGPGKPATSAGVWANEIIAHGVAFDSISVTNLNNERRLLHYDVTVYPSRGTPGAPLTVGAAIMNDPCPDAGTACR